MNLNLKKAKWLIPVLAVLVIFESVLIVQKVNNRGDMGTEEKGSIKDIVDTESTVEIKLVGDETNVVGNTGEVDVVMTPFEDTVLDGIDVLVEYDPEYLDIVGTIPSDSFSYVARNWIEPEKKRILVSMVETESVEGVSFVAGGEVVLVNFQYTALKSGTTTLKIAGSDKGTVLAENGTAEKVPFSSKDLTLVIK